MIGIYDNFKLHDKFALLLGYTGTCKLNKCESQEKLLWYSKKGLDS